MRVMSALLSFIMFFSSVPMQASNLVEVARRDFTEKIVVPNWDYDGNSYVDLVDGKRVMSVAPGASIKTVLEVEKASGTLEVDVNGVVENEVVLSITNASKEEHILVEGKNSISFVDLVGEVTIEIRNTSSKKLVVNSISSSEFTVENGDFSEKLSIPGFNVTAEHILVKDKVLELHDISSNANAAVKTTEIKVDGSTGHLLKVDLEVIKQSHSVEIGVTYLDANGKSLKYVNELMRNKAGTGRFIQELNLPVVANTESLVITLNSGLVSITEAKFYSLSLLANSEEVIEEVVHEKLLNPGFEDGLNNWVVINENTPFTTSKDKAVEGVSSLYMHDSVSEGENTTARILSNKVKATVGTTYLVSAKVNVTSQSHSIVMVTEYYDQDGTLLKTFEELFSSNSLGTDKWTTIRQMTEAPAKTSFMRVGFYSGKPSITKAHFDDVNIATIDNSQNLDRNYSDPINLGSMVDVGLGQAGAIGVNALGEREVYFISNGSPGTFYALDADTGAVKHSKVIPNTIAVWAITIGLDKNVYFGGTEDGKMYRYVPETLEVEDLGANPADKWIWDLEVAENGKIYGTTYPNAKLFEYDPVTKAFTDFGKMHEVQQYARGLGIDGDDIYVGIGTNAKHLIKYSISKGTKEEVIIDGHSGTSGTFEDIRIVGDYLFLSNGSINMLVVDKNTLEVVSTFQYSNNIAYPSVEDPNHVYFKFEKKFFEFNLDTLEKTEIELEYDLPDTVRTKDIKWVKHNGIAKIALLTQYAEYMVIDPTNGDVDFISLEVSMQSVDIQALEVGFDGRLYLGGYQRGMSIYNPFTNERDLNLPNFAQPEGIGFLNDRVWYGTYVDAIMYSFDPTKEVSHAQNPKYEYKIKDEQDRPFAIESGDDKLFVGTIPNYGVHGGVLAIYDEKTNTWTQHRNVVKDQSIISLAYKDGFVYGGTSVWGGLGSDPVAKEAEMFIWDVENEKLVKSFTLDIPNIDEAPRMIGDLTFGPDGLLWGVVDGTIFAYDIETESVVKSKMIQPSLYNSSKWFPYRLHFAPDGLIYSTVSRKLVAIDPETLDHKIVVDKFMNNMTIGLDGTIYYALKNELYMIKVAETDATLSDITVNGETIDGFSSGVLDYEVEVLVESLDEEVSIDATTTQANATYTLTKEGDITIITVVGEDGVSTLSYRVKVTKVLDDETGPVDPVDPVDPILPPDEGELPATGFSMYESLMGVASLMLGLSIVLINRKRKQRS